MDTFIEADYMENVKVYFKRIDDIMMPMTGRRNDMAEVHKKEIALEAASRHIENNIVPAVPGRKCVDGRYEDNTAHIARAGGDMGYVQVLLALNKEKNLGLTWRQAFYMVYDTVTRDGGKFYMHTDTHADPVDGQQHGHEGGVKIGCGHCAKAANPAIAAKYGIDPDEMQEVIKFAKEQVAQKNNKIVMVTLEGDHAEKGAIIVDSDKFTVNPNNRKQHSQYFIYDKQRDEVYMEWLVEKMQIPGVTIEDFKQKAEKQTNVTLSELASGKPVVHAAINEHGIAHLSYVGEIPEAA